MKASVYTRYGAPEVLRIQEIEQPKPRENQILVRVHATPITAADCIFRRGDSFVARLFGGLRKPKSTILGSELAGEVIETGLNVRRFQEGDRIIASTGAGMGSHVEYICLDENAAIAKLPAEMSLVDAAALCEGGLTALHFLRDTAKIKEGQKILINGASGAVGSMAVQIAKVYGAEVTGVCSAANLQMVRELGADQVIDYLTEDFTQMGENYDIVFDAIGKSSFSRAKKALKPKGLYLTTVPNLTIMLQMMRTAIIGKKRAKFAAAGLTKAVQKVKSFRYLMQLAESGVIRPVIDKCYPLSGIIEANRYVDSGRKRGNVIVTWN